MINIKQSIDDVLNVISRDDIDFKNPKTLKHIKVMLYRISLDTAEEIRTQQNHELFLFRNQLEKLRNENI